MADQGTRRGALAAMGILEWVPRALESAGAGVPVPDPIPASGQAAARVEVSAAPDVEASTLDWPALEQAVSTCQRCALAGGRTQTVFGVGSRAARWMIIGEAPGQEEDRQGEPFVGRAGQLLNAMLSSVGLARSEVFIANILKCRPPDNRDPEPAEAKACRGWLARQIELVNPTLILCVGRIAAQNLLGVSTSIGKLRGQRHEYLPLGIPVVVTWHPAYLLRSPLEKRRAWDDLRLARQVFEERG